MDNPNRTTPAAGFLPVLREEKEVRLPGGLYHLTQIKLTYNSNHIEGSKLSEEQTRYIFETNTIGLAEGEAVSVDDIVETVNHFRCIDFVIDIAEQSLSEDMIKKIHEILKTGTSDSRKDWFAVGDYKKKPNVVGGSATTPPSRVAAEMKKALAAYNSIHAAAFEDVVAFHHTFETIHPFQDGNGRVGRLIAFKECLRLGLTPFIIDDSLKFFYYRGLKEWDSQKGYLMDTCRAGQDIYQAMAAYFE